MKRYKILLLNCTSREEPNEAVFLGELFNMVQRRYRKSVQYKKVEAQSKKEFEEALKENWANVIHISAHGTSKKHASGRRGKLTSIQVGDENITSENIAELGRLDAKLVFVSACLNSYKDMASAFIDELGVNRYIAPKTKVDWVQAAMFAAMFYKRYLWDRTRLETAFQYAKKHTKSGKDFREYWTP